MRGQNRMIFTTMLLLALAVSPSDVRSAPSSPSVVADGSPATTVSGSPAPVLELLGRWHGGPVYSSAVSGDHVYFGTGGSIRVLKIEQASEQHTSWKEMASIGTSGIVRGLDASGSHLYVADESGALRIIDVSDPQVPIEIGHLLPKGRRVDVRGVDVAGSHAYLAAGYDAGLSVVDISDPKNPREVGNYDTPRSARSVRVSGSYAYVGDLKWLRVFDVSKPSAPREIASYKAPANAAGIWIDHSTVYVAARQAGLMILGIEAQRK